MKKQKCVILVPKMFYLSIFGQECLIWVFLRKNFKKTIVIFEINTPKFFYFQNFAKKQKRLKFRQKMLDQGVFVLEFENIFIIFEISHLEFVKVQNFTKKNA